MFKVFSKGNYSKTREDLNRLQSGKNLSDLDRYGLMGVEALSSATPVDTGLTADSWDYRITHDGTWTGIEWFNTNEAGPGWPSVAILIQYGHGTRGGTYISGIDYINPAMRVVFDDIVNDVWKKVTA